MKVYEGGISRSLAVEREESFLVDSGATSSLVTGKFNDTRRSCPVFLASGISVRYDTGIPVETQRTAVFPFEIYGQEYINECIAVSTLEGHDRFLGWTFVWKKQLWDINATE